MLAGFLCYGDGKGAGRELWNLSYSSSSQLSPFTSLKSITVKSPICWRLFFGSKRGVGGSVDGRSVKCVLITSSPLSLLFLYVGLI